jgi:hypothetical protein
MKKVEIVSLWASVHSDFAIRLGLLESDSSSLFRLSQEFSGKQLTHDTALAKTENVKARKIRRLEMQHLNGELCCAAFCVG